VSRETSSNADSGHEWVSARERGSRFALGFLVWCIRRVGRAPLRLLLAPIATYYCLFARGARHASQAYLARIDRAQGGAGEPPGLRATYRHLYSFAEAILDRFALWAGAPDCFEAVLHGREHMEHYVEGRRSAILVGAHLGSFDVLRVIAREAKIPVNVLMYTENAQRINETFQALDPDCNVRVIEIDPTSMRTAFEVRRCVERGEFVAVLADRVHPGGRDRIAHANFLGDPAPFPEGPFLLAMVLRLPVVLTIALKTGPRTYEVFLESLAEGDPVPAQDRAKVLRERIENFAARLEHYCMRAPQQWYNFYDFWADVEHERH
jgi:predicted LPLAT superfamily acyltransferase